jgi:hypothetical protein
MDQLAAAVSHTWGQVLVELVDTTCEERGYPRRPVTGPGLDE